MDEPVRALTPRDGVYWLDDTDPPTPIKDKWNTASGLLESPRRPTEGDIWKPFAISRAGAETWSVYIYHRVSASLAVWSIGLDGEFISQRLASLPEALALIDDKVFDGSVGYAPHLLARGERGLARRAALNSARHPSGSEAALEFLVALYASEGRTVAARRLLARLNRLRDKARRQTWFGAEAARRIFVNGLHTSRRASILYLLQNPGALAGEMEDALTTDASDFVCLTFRRNHFDNRYTYQPGSTWTQGRNILFRLSRQELSGYDYYVFCDGDFRFRNMRLSEGINSFNNALIEHRPEIAVPANSWHVIWGSRIDPSQAVTPIYGFDAMFNAFSSHVIKDDILMPYIESFDSDSWYVSQALLFKLAGLYYEPVQFNRVDVMNDEHGLYPRFDVREDRMNSLVKILTGFDPNLDSGAPKAVKRMRRLSFNRPVRDSTHTTSILTNMT